METRHEICVALDKLAIELLSLIEQKVQCQVNIENTMKSANVHLAKSRYIMGQQTVSKLQLPTENTPDFLALSTINRNTVNFNDADINHYELDTRKSENNTLYINPIKWFGVLVPQNLHQAQNLYKKTLEHVIESANIQMQIEATCENIKALTKKKEKLSPEE